MENMQKKTVLVTGGAGYVGSILVRRLLEAGCRVVCLDCLKFGGRSLVDVCDHPRFVFYRQDITRHDEVNRILDKEMPWAIVHLAAIVGDPACKREPELAAAINRDASVNLATWAAGNGCERFIFASTCSNYGKMDDPEGFVTETSPLSPVSLYAELKVEFENTLIKQNRQDGFAPTALRFATVYGMSPRMRFDLTVNEFTKELALERELVIFGEQFWRPYCYVGDFSRAIITVLSAPPDKVAYNVFNVGDTGQNYTKKMIADELIRQVPGARVRYVKKDEDPRDYRVDFTKINKELGFTISKTVPEGIGDIYSALKAGIIENPDDQFHYNIPVKQDT